MYSDTARIYDLLHHFKDYGREADYLTSLVQARRPAARTLLDVACGTGNHLAALGGRFSAEGLDSSPEMLAQARQKLPGLALHEASMTDFELYRRFDVVCCLYSSVAATRTRPGLESAVASMARHLAPGGLLLLEPYFTPETFWVGHLKLHELRRPELTVAWMYCSERQGELGVLHNHYLIGEHGAIRHAFEDHVLGLFRSADFEQAFAAAGLALEFDADWPSSHGLYIGQAAG